MQDANDFASSAALHAGWAPPLWKLTPPPVNRQLAELVRLLTLERLEANLFRGASCDIGTPQVFGGQVLGQALAAAYSTVGRRDVHSLHAYFLRRGDFSAPIVYEVHRSRDGSSFSSRRVAATQHGEQLLHMAVSFHEPEEGLEHELGMPDVPAPETLSDARRLPEAAHSYVPEMFRATIKRDKPFEFRFVHPPRASHASGAVSGRQQFWFRAIARLPDDDTLHRCLLGYVSDYYLLAAAVRPHGVSGRRAIQFAASIDHAVWFHRPARVDEWLLYVMDSPSASSGRGLTRASIFARNGHLVASTAQESLIRVRRSGRRQKVARLLI